MSSPLYIGMISGTSRDGMDAVLVAMDGGQPRLLSARCAAYPGALRESIDALIALGRCPTPEEAARTDQELGYFCVDVCRALLQDAGVESEALSAVGSHGQTVWHDPSANPPVSLQIGNATVIERALRIPVIANFRDADLHAGGEGAPLAPLLHQALFAQRAPCAVINLGGIANVTLLDKHGAVRGFDTGPANCLLDGWTMEHRHMPFDAGGSFAEAGELLPALLERLLDEPYFTTPPPKSTGLELFNRDWLDARLQGEEAPEDVQRTLLELTVETVARAIELAREKPRQLLLCGGGIHNRFLVRRLEERLAPRAVASTAIAGVDPDWIEATLFAWLAHRRLQEMPSETGPITGARAPVLLGERVA